MSEPRIVDADRYGNTAPNRGLDTRREADGEQNISVGLQDIDTAIVEYITDKIRPWVTQDDVRVEVPLIFANPERWKSAQKDGVLRDEAGKIQVPMMLISRPSIKKNSLNSPINRYLTQTFGVSQWNRRNAYDRFAVQNGIIPSQEFMSVVRPDYYDVTYDCIIWTAFQTQMNQVVEQISFEVDNYWGPESGFKFKTSVDAYEMEVNLPENADRTVTTTFSMKVNAYILPEDMLDEHGRPQNVSKISFSPKKIVIEEKIETS